MKFEIFLLAFATLTVALPSCSSDDDDITNVPQAAISAMSEKYPQAIFVTWENKRNFSVADFINNSMEHEAWFDKTGQWHMTEVDMLFKDLPVAVQSSFNKSEYATWRVDDVDKVERYEMETVYVIEVEQGAKEYDLYYTADGTLVKAVPDSDNNDYHPSAELPKAIHDFISERYPNAKIVNFDLDAVSNGLIPSAFIEVYILDANILRKIEFGMDYTWWCTVTDIDHANWPDLIVKAFNESEYSMNFNIANIYYWEHSFRNTYILDVTDGTNSGFLLEISTEGVVIGHIIIE